MEEEGRRRRTVQPPPAMQGTKARMGTVRARTPDMERSRPLGRHMIHTVEGTRTGRMVEDKGLGTVTLAALEAGRRLVAEATGAYRPRRILVDRYVRSLRRGG
jgi:hypothetical protein